MSKTPNEQLLHELIHSLTKSEKRSFKLYANRSSTRNDAKFIKLFDILEKMNTYDEIAILKKMPKTSKTQMANLKVHLYGQVLGSLRLSNLKDDIDIELREQLDFIRILYKKGLYSQSLRLLNRAKKITGDYRKDLFELALLDYEKQIRSQQVFDLAENQADAIDQATEEAMSRFMNVQRFFTLATKLKARFVEKGMIKSEKELNNLKALFYTKLPHFKEEELAFNEKFYLYRAYYWFSYLTYNFEECFVYAEKWINLFHGNDLTHKRKAGYLKGLNRLLQSAFRIDDREKFDKYYDLLIEFDQQNKETLASNTQVLLTKYRTIQLFNHTFLHASFSEAAEAVAATLEVVMENKKFIDQHNLLVIYYKAAVYYFACQDYEQAKYLLKLLIQDSDALRSDLKGYARLIHIIIDFETGDVEDFDREIKAMEKYILEEENMGEIQQLFIAFMSQSARIYPQELPTAFKQLKRNLENITKDDFENKTLLYFDLMSWVDAQITGKSFADIIRQKVSKP